MGDMAIRRHEREEARLNGSLIAHRERIVPAAWSKWIFAQHGEQHG